MNPAPNELAGDLEAILQLTRDDWKLLSDARIFVTGGTGFIGSWLIDSFGWARRSLGLRAEMVVLSRDPDTFGAKEPQLASIDGLRFVKGDVRTFAFTDEKFTHVIHGATAASARLNIDAPLVMLDTIVEGTRRALDFAVHSGAKVFMNLSSGAVYGRQPPSLSHVSEDYPGAPDPFDPWSAYGEGKRQAELLGTLYSKRHGLEHKVARIFALVGPRLPLDIHYAMGNFIRDGLQGGPIVVGGDGRPFRSYLYAADLTAWLWIILARGASCRAYNVGSDQALTIADTAREVSEAFGGAIPVEIARKAPPGQPGDRYVPSIARISAELGVRPTVALTDGIKRTVAWQRRAVLP